MQIYDLYRISNGSHFHENMLLIMYYYYLYFQYIHAITVFIAHISQRHVYISFNHLIDTLSHPLAYSENGKER